METIFELILLLLAVLVHVSRGWPEGTFGLPMPKSGCPKADNFAWQTGTRTQQTEQGSHASDNNHLAGIESTKKHPENKVVQTFCMKNSYAGDGEFRWQKGKYCIYQKGACPSGFDNGWIYWDDATPLWSESLIQGKTGSLPDGSYDRNTKITYCCRKDGYAADPIKMPTTSPFYLMKFGQQCQSVMGMDANEEWVYWSDEDTLNLNNHGGVYPKVQRSKYPYKYTKLFYCYYTQKAPNNSLQTSLTIIYIIAGVVGLLIVVFVLICLIQRCCMCRQKRNERAAAHQRRGTGSVIYKPSGSDADSSVDMSPPPLNKIKPPLQQKKHHAKNGATPSAPPADSDSDSDSDRNGPREGDEDFVPMIIGPDGRPMSQPPSYDDVLKEDHRSKRGLLSKFGNEMYEDELIREDLKL